MKTNKKFLTILTLCIALLLTACGATDAAGTDKTNESLNRHSIHRQLQHCTE